jgi:DNA-binding NtrC family response regulator
MLMRVFVVAESSQVRERLLKILSSDDVLTSSVIVPKKGNFWQRVSSESFDILVVSRSALPEPPAVSVAALGELPDRPKVIVFQKREDPEERAALLAAGCLATVNGKLSIATLRAAISALIDRQREVMCTQLSHNQSWQNSLSDFASSSAPMRELLYLAKRVSGSDASLFIHGETGVGKEWLARGIHAQSTRSAFPFITVNCCAVPEDLVESELFGHEEGAFTGAKRSRRGYFELAHRGTIFLDEVAEMEPRLQTKLLRVLQERKIQRLGGEQELEVDIRIMAATNRNVEEALSARLFRSDLYYRLSVINLHMPPLRERKEDIPDLVKAYVDRFGMQLSRPIGGPTEEALQALVEYDWPGNVRELINVVERAVLLSEGVEIALSDLPDSISRIRKDRLESMRGDPQHVLKDGWLEMPLRKVRREVLTNVEYSYLSELLRKNRGRIDLTAQQAGIDPRSLYEKMRRLGLDKKDFKRKQVGSS